MFITALFFTGYLFYMQHYVTTKYELPTLLVLWELEYHKTTVIYILNYKFEVCGSNVNNIHNFTPQRVIPATIIICISSLWDFKMIKHRESKNMKRYIFSYYFTLSPGYYSLKSYSVRGISNVYRATAMLKIPISGLDEAMWLGDARKPTTGDCHYSGRWWNRYVPNSLDTGVK